MQLVSIRIGHHRRFEKSSTLSLSPRVVAIVGPKEAGKSTLLEALARISTKEEWALADFPGRQRPKDSDAEVIGAMFLLDDEDRAALSAVPGARAIEAYVAGKSVDGTPGQMFILGRLAIVRDEMH